mgnify:CR=1 FL=1
MTEPVKCHNGVCKHTQTNFLDECIDCNIVDQIERDLLKEQMGM